MREIEASRKWCPFVQIAIVGQAVCTNRGRLTESPSKGSYNCIGENCMAWIFTDGCNGRCSLIEK